MTKGLNVLFKKVLNRNLRFLRFYVSVLFSDASLSLFLPIINLNLDYIDRNYFKDGDKVAPLQNILYIYKNFIFFF